MLHSFNIRGSKTLDLLELHKQFIETVNVAC